MKRALISIAACAWPALASAGPTRLAMQWVRGDSVHLAGRGGAINRRDSVKLELALEAGGRIRGTDTGTTSEHNLYETFSTTEEARWTNTWSGAWTMRGAALRLELVLDARKCTRTKTSTGAPPEQLACGAVSKQVAMECELAQITVEEAGAARKATRHEAWRCTPAGAADLDETPSTWVLGKAVCLQTIGGRGGPSYQRCKP